jgi:hypothetical protein
MILEISDCISDRRRLKFQNLIYFSITQISAVPAQFFIVREPAA